MSYIQTRLAYLKLFIPVSSAVKASIFLSLGLLKDSVEKKIYFRRIWTRNLFH